MVSRVRLVIILYILSGILTVLIGFLVILLVNTGVLLQDTLIRYVVIALALISMLIGTHLAVAGVASLRNTQHF